jgi:isoleucyl-tRNA synthetase
MYEGGVIYRDNRLVNWCCKLKTAVSDIEVGTFRACQCIFVQAACLACPGHQLLDTTHHWL